MTSGPYDPYVLGYTCATILYTKRFKPFKVKVRKTLWNKEYEVGFNSNQKVERSGEYGSSVRTNRPSSLPSKES